MTTPIDAIDIITVIAFAGGTSFVGAIISKKIKFSEQQILSLTAFGAGILISAAIFEMVIEAEKSIGIMLTLIAFIAGSIIFTIAYIVAEKRGGGAGILIGIQNVPEGIASYREMMTRKTAFSHNARKALCAIGIVSVIPI